MMTTTFYRCIFLRFFKALFAVALLGGLAATEAQALDLTLTVGNTERRAIVVNEPPAGEIRPVVLVLHGGRGSAEAQQARTGFDQLALREGFMAVYPEGTEYGAQGFHAWNTGYLMRDQVATADDVAFFDALIDRLIQQYGADPRRIYMTGGSNGGMMVFVYAVQRPAKLAAVAPVVGAMFSFGRKPSVPVPIMMINGAKDEEVPIKGGMSRNPLVRQAQAAPYKSLSATVSFWAKANRSARKPVTSVRGTVRTQTYAATRDGAVTISVVDSAAGHGWPGIAPSGRGNTPIQSFDGAEKVWSFFKTQARP
ncbi:MAG: alpha/beta hydrolase family esterase [Aestuariivirga sp.]|uniref:alpha/beta hydrolase family esterase n=1 Tax=Aestuariivirga sp. TaxID=2650926 RepID=UPI0038CFB74D